MEGKEAASASRRRPVCAITTAASCGAVNGMHDSFTRSAARALALMQLGEVVFGGVGAGLYGMLIFAIWRSSSPADDRPHPEYLGKKIETYEMKMVSVAILVTPILVLAGAAVAVLAEPARRASPTRAHGFSEILYAFTSAGNNNGSAFAGLSANTPFYNTMLASRCGSAASASSCPCWPSPARWRRRSAWR